MRNIAVLTICMLAIAVVLVQRQVLSQPAQQPVVEMQSQNLMQPPQPQIYPGSNPFTSAVPSSSPDSSERGTIVDVNGNLKILKPGEKLPNASPPQEVKSEPAPPPPNSSAPAADSSSLVPSTERVAVP